MNRSFLIIPLWAVVFASGCATDKSVRGPKGPELVTSGRVSESGQYAEVGMEFSTWGDFVALVSPSRWKSPIATGGSLSWMNPGAWRQDAGRTGRILLGEAVTIGGAIAVADASFSRGDSNTGGDSGTTSPPPPSGGGGTVPPPPGL